MKKTLLKAIGLALAIGCAPVGALDSTIPPGAAISTGYQQALAAGAAAISAQGLSIGEAHAGTLQLPTGVVNGPALPSSHSQIVLSTAPAPGSSRASGTGDGRQVGGYLVSVAAVPEPSGGAMLLCGLAVLAFIARRKTQSVVD